MKEAKRFSGYGGDVAQRISLFPYMTSCGEGFLDLFKILTVAEQNGVEYFFWTRYSSKFRNSIEKKSFKRVT